MIDILLGSLLQVKKLNYKIVNYEKRHFRLDLEMSFFSCKFSLTNADTSIKIVLDKTKKEGEYAEVYHWIGNHKVKS